MPMPSETVALPMVKGVDLTTDARLLNPPALLEATNTRFTGGGAKKRRGHTPIYMRGEGAPTGGLTTWAYGVGYLTARGTGEEETDLWTSAIPDVGNLQGVAVRDDEMVVWDGFRLFSYLPSQADAQNSIFAEVGNAVMPHLRATPTAKSNLRQSLPEMADTGVTKIVAWIDDTASAVVRYQIQDTESGTVISEGTFSEVATPAYLRAFTLENWMHVAVLDSANDRVQLYSIISSAPNEVTNRSLGDCDGHFDIWKTADTEVMVTKTHGTTVYVTFLQSNGSGSPTRDPFTYATGSTSATLVSGAMAVSGSHDIALAWLSPSQHIGLAVLSSAGVLRHATTITSNYTSTTRLTIAPKLAVTDLGYDLWDLFWDDTTFIRSARVWRAASTLETGTQKHAVGLQVASRAFTVGDRTFVWAGRSSTIQSVWLLLDESLKPVGHADFGLANLPSTAGAIFGINWSGSSAAEYTFHHAISHKLRVVPDNSDKATGAIYTEPAIKAAYLDFLPPMRTAQAGRSLYIAGAQLWAYDGKEAVEAGFHVGPEVTPVQAPGGALTVDGTYSYRIDVCYRNAQNEEVRSLSILSDSVTLSGGNRTISITWKPIITRRESSYFLVYRNAMSSGVPLANWWLLNSRDPADASFISNDQTATTIYLVDSGAVTDTVIQTRELHPASDTWLQPVAAPACEVIAAGRDRLWVAGGELLPGELAPSRLFDPGDVPAFNNYLNIQVDRSNEPVTAIGFAGEVALIFRPNSTYILDSDGPDNNASGFWSPVRLAIADIGAISQESIARITQGIIFQSPAGFRVVGPGGALTPIGVPVDVYAASFDVVGTLVIEKDQEVRFYGETACLVYNYLYDTWAYWTVGGVGVAKNNTGYGLVARSDGYLWVEAPGVWTDGGNTYTHRIRTSWLHGGNLGDFQRVRRIGGIGRFADLDNPDHSLRLDLYFDNREFWEDRIEWTLPDSTTNEDTWGSGTWGAGVWGDTSASISNLEDLTWDWVRMPAIQKCNAVSIALEDYNTDGPGFELSALVLEVARKQGLFKNPERTGSGTYR